MNKPEYVYVIYRGGEPYAHYIDSDLRDRHLLALMKGDKEQKYTWSTVGYRITNSAS